MRSTRFPDVATACAVAVLAALLCTGLVHPLQNLNEGLYARIAQEMLESHGWIVPTLDGVPYLEKPPLLYWITAASFALFGPGEVAARAAPVLGALLMLSATATFAWRCYGSRTALFASLILASSPIFVGLARTLLFDGLFTGLLAWSLVLAHEAMAAPGQRQYLRASYAVLALAVLTKGLAALVFFAVIVLAAIACAPRGERAWRLRLLMDPWALALFAALAFPWHVAVLLREPSFGWFYFWNEHVGRFLDARWPHDYHTGPLWYYLPRVAGYAFPWILLLAVRGKAPPAAHGPLRGFVAAWFLVPLAIFSLSGAKGDYYMIVGMPPLALVLARRLEAARGVSLTVAMPALAMAALAAFLSALAWHPVYYMPSDARVLLTAAFAVLTVAAGAFAIKHVRAGAVALAAFGVVVSMLFSGFLEANENVRSARSLAQVVRELRPARIFVYRDFERLSALPYYLRHPVGVVDSHSRDLLFGMRLRPDDARFPAPQALVTGPVQDTLLIVPDDRMAAFHTSVLAWQFERIGRVGPFYLFRHPASQRLAARNGLSAAR